MSPETALAICRFAHDASAMLLFGAFAYLSALVPRDLALAVGRCLGRMRVAAIALAVATTVALLPLDAAAIGDGWGDALAPRTIRDVLVGTRVGTAWQVQMVTALLLAATLAGPSRHRPRATALAAGLLLASLALTGHAAMHEGWLGAAHRLNDIVHVLSGGAWLGALVPLVPILRALDDAQRRSEAGVALRRFSKAGHAAVALVIASGLVNMGLVLGRWPTAWSSPYPALLAGKIALVAAMTVLALVNRYALVPAIRRQPDAAVRALRLGTAVEIGLGLVVLGLVATFGLLEPA